MYISNIILIELLRIYDENEIFFVIVDFDIMTKITFDNFH